MRLGEVGPPQAAGNQPCLREDEVFADGKITLKSPAVYLPSRMGRRLHKWHHECLAQPRSEHEDHDSLERIKTLLLRNKEFVLKMMGVKNSEQTLVIFREELERKEDAIENTWKVSAA